MPRVALTAPSPDDALLAAARAQPGTLQCHPAPLSLKGGGRALALWHGENGQLLVLAARDFAGGFTLLGEAVAPTRYRPRQVARAVSAEGEPWTATLTRAQRLAAQLRGWLKAELARDERAQALGALERWRRGEAPPTPVVVNGLALSWAPAQECWSCLDLASGEVVRLAARADTLYALARAGAEALSLAGQAWAYSLLDPRTPISVCACGEEFRARRGPAGAGEQLLVTYFRGTPRPARLAPAAQR